MIIIIIIITVDSLLTDTSLRRTLSAGSKGVRLRESWLYFIFLKTLAIRPVPQAAIGLSFLNLTVRKMCSSFLFPKNCQRL